MIETGEMMTKQLVVELPITVAEWQNADGDWVIEGIDYPVEIVTTDIDSGEKAMRIHAKYHWEYMRELMYAAIAPPGGDAS